MKILKKSYYYLFYKFYRFWDSVSGDSWSDFKALVFIGGFDVFLLLSIDIYIKVIFKKAIILDLPKPAFILLFLGIVVSNYFIFLHQNGWQDIVREFDKLSKKKNYTGSWIVLGIVLFVISNLIFSFYLMSRIDWSQYR